MLSCSNGILSLCVANLFSKKLILSAGINVNQYGETVDHIDRHFEVNWLGQFYVVNLLYPLLRKTSKLPDTPAPRSRSCCVISHIPIYQGSYFGSPLSGLRQHSPKSAPMYLQNAKFLEYSAAILPVQPVPAARERNAHPAPASRPAGRNKNMRSFQSYLEESMRAHEKN